MLKDDSIRICSVTELLLHVLSPHFLLLGSFLYGGGVGMLLARPPAAMQVHG